MDEYNFGNNTILNVTESIIANYTNYPTLQPNNITFFTSIPSCSPIIQSTFNPTQGEFHLVQDITNPAKFNFIAFMLGLSFLMIIVGVTITGIFYFFNNIIYYYCYLITKNNNNNNILL